MIRFDAGKLLAKAWGEWIGLSVWYPGDFGKYFINNYVEGYKNYDIYYETNNEKAYTGLLWEIASGKLDGKLVDNSNPVEYTTKTNQEGGA